MKFRTILIAVAATILASCAAQKSEDTFDTVIRNGTIVDGTGNPRFTADIGIRDGRIAALGIIPENSGNVTIDAAGKIVSPGFIDIHTHTDGVTDDPSAHNYILQGVTTVIDGNCGGSSVELDKHFQKIRSKGIALNYGTLIGHNSIRSKIMGGADREPTPDELETMKLMVADGMKAGAVGLSTGLKYKPGIFSKTDDVIELAKVAASYGGFYASHMRSEGEKVIESVKEAIEIGEKADIPIQISHHKILSVKRWGDSVETLRLIEEARANGVDVKADQYPYTASSTGLAVLLPPWSLEGDGWKDRAKDPATRAKIIKDMIDTIVNERAGNDLNRIQIAKYETDTSIEGKGLRDILEMKEIDPTLDNAAELVLELLSKGRASAIYHAIGEEDIARIMSNPSVMVASDGHVTEIGDGVPHPRCYGTFPRVLAHYVREKGILTLEDAVRKMTQLVASQIGSEDRGVIAEGKCADIVIFDKDTIRDTATFQAPHSYPEGIDYVMVNGEIVVDHGAVTSALPGKVFYGSGKK